ncbi:helix-turn-helix domain-containing protein [Micromonospora sp. SL1-18]|uniref:AlbA family DNA-binding domain-containing protein n=1 Tax=Micromonospora sp. SL1-18 TaxID=3399128 RepID=UPI003A4DF64C
MTRKSVREQHRMRAIEVEEWARRIVERIRNGGPVEDSRVELKRAWPEDHGKAARRIAGHCNANSGELLLWLIGVDESGGVIGVPAQDMATWWPSVRARFDGMSPGVKDVVVDFEGHEIVALIFDADRAPFVVKNPKYGQQGGGAVELEVPWRDATSVRSAKREDLVRLLVPRQRLPEVSVVDSYAQLSPHGELLQLQCSVVVYAVIPMGQAIVLPDHQASGIIRIGNSHDALGLNIDLLAKRDGYFHPVHNSKDGRFHTALQGDNQVILEGPGFFRVVGRTYLQTTPADCEQLTVTAHIRLAGSDLSFAVEAIMNSPKQRPHPKGTTIEWTHKPHAQDVNPATP